MMKKTTSQLSDLIEPCLPFESQLASGYYQFLMKHDPMHHWEDVRPLASAIETHSNFHLDEGEVKKIAAIFPSLPSELAEADLWGRIASALGFRYAWTRVHMHMKALTQIEPHLSGETAIIEPGVGGGGLIHYLPSQHPIAYLGVDCSSQALDVCRALEQANEITGKRILTRANFYAFHKSHLPPLGIDVERTIVFFSSFLSNANSLWHTFPCINPAIVASWLISYWVNAGARVLLCERCDDGDRFVRFMVENGNWEADCKAEILDEFETYSTYESSIANPVGDWRTSRCVVASFHR
jgi:hypothetical protein